MNTITTRHAGTPRPQSARLQTLASVWRGKSAPCKRDWNLAAARVYARHFAHTGATKQTGYNLWVSVGSALLAQNLPLPDGPPPDFSPPQPLQPCALTATVSPALALTVTPAAPQSSRVLVYACAPQVEAASPHRPSGYVHIATLAGLDGPTALQTAYGKRFCVPEACYEITLKLVPLTPAGRRGTPVFVQAVSRALAHSHAGHLTI